MEKCPYNTLPPRGIAESFPDQFPNPRSYPCAKKSALVNLEEPDTSNRLGFGSLGNKDDEIKNIKRLFADCPEE